MSGLSSGNELSRNPGSVARQEEAKPIKIDSRGGTVRCVAFLVDGMHLVSGDNDGKIRRWRVEDGKEVGVPMDAGSLVKSIAVSRDGKWVVSGTQDGLVTVWNAETGEKAKVLKGHSAAVSVVDVSPDGTRVASGSGDKTVCIWSISTGKQFLGPWNHDNTLDAVKFSPDGTLIATATWDQSIHIHDTQSGRLMVDVPIRVASGFNRSLAWDSNNKQLFALSRSLDGNIYCLDVTTGTPLARWRIHDGTRPRCIAVAGNGRFIVASNGSSVSFWDITTHQQIGSVVEHTDSIWSLAISANYDLVIEGDQQITLHSIGDILPLHYIDIVSINAFKNLIAWDSPLLTTNCFVAADLKATINIIHASDTVLEFWRKDKLLNAIEMLSRERKQKDELEHVLANRALLRARLRQWGPAIRDARNSIAVKPTILAYIALSIALFGKGEARRANKVFNRLFCHCYVKHMWFIYLVKAIIIFTSGSYEDGMLRVAILISLCTGLSATLCRAVQAHMYVISGKAYMRQQQYEMVLKPLDNQRDQELPCIPNHPQFMCISSMFGWTHDPEELRFTLYQQQCEALYALQRQEEATKLLQVASKDLEGQSEKRKEIKKWLRDFSKRCGVPTEDAADDSPDSPAVDTSNTNRRSRRGRATRFLRFLYRS